VDNISSPYRVEVIFNGRVIGFLPYHKRFAYKESGEVINPNNNLSDKQYTTFFKPDEGQTLSSFMEEYNIKGRSSSINISIEIKSFIRFKPYFITIRRLIISNICSITKKICFDCVFASPLISFASASRSPRVALTVFSRALNRSPISPFVLSS